MLVLSLVTISFIWGTTLDYSDTLEQTQIFLGLQVASFSGALSGSVLVARNYRNVFAWFFFSALALVAWRLAYFPIMVFSGHVASIGEWIQFSLYLPTFVYPVFLCSVLFLHLLSARALIKLFHRPNWLFTGAIIPAFAVAFSVSFSDSRDWTWSPDSNIQTIREVPKPRAAERNPYLSALSDSRYGVRQRVMLVAAGVTYETIPPSPWATSVKAVLEGLFAQNPIASTHDRVFEHYQAYHSAHSFIRCQDFEECLLASSSAKNANGRDRSANDEVPEEKTNDY